MTSGKRLHAIYNEIQNDPSYNGSELAYINSNLSELMCTIDIFLRRLNDVRYYYSNNSESVTKRLDSTITKAYKLITEAKNLSEEINRLNEEWKKLPITQAKKRNEIMREMSRLIDYRATVIEKARNASIACKTNIHIQEAITSNESSSIEKENNALTHSHYYKTITDLINNYNNCIDKYKLNYVKPLKLEEVKLKTLTKLKQDVEDEINNLYAYYTKLKGEDLNEA